MIRVRPKPIQHVRKLLNGTWNYSSSTKNGIRSLFGDTANTRLSQSQTSPVSYMLKSPDSRQLRSMLVSSSYDPDYKRLTEWIGSLFKMKKTHTQRKSIVNAFENSDFDNMNAIYNGLTYTTH